MNKKSSKIINIIIISFFVCFMILYICKEAGYYEYKTYKKVTMTEEAIKRFEKDIQDGKDVNKNDYITIEKTDYSNKISNLGASMGSVIDEIMNGFLKKGIKILSSLFWE